MKAICDGTSDLSAVPSELRNALISCWHGNPNKRPTFLEMMNRGYVQVNVVIVAVMMMVMMVMLMMWRRKLMMVEKV